jgi:hypothetical protein
MELWCRNSNSFLPITLGPGCLETRRVAPNGELLGIVPQTPELRHVVNNKVKDMNNYCNLYIAKLFVRASTPTYFGSDGRSIKQLLWLQTPLAAAFVR